jgi:hypothetical protein
MGGPFVIIFLALAGGAIYGSTKTIIDQLLKKHAILGLYCKAFLTCK